LNVAPVNSITLLLITKIDAPRERSLVIGAGLKNVSPCIRRGFPFIAKMNVLQRSVAFLPRAWLLFSSPLWQRGLGDLPEE